MTMFNYAPVSDFEQNKIVHMCENRSTEEVSRQAARLARAEEKINRNPSRRRALRHPIVFQLSIVLCSRVNLASKGKPSRGSS